MPSPFPGMDPYLEHPKLWPAFQHQVLACLYQILLPGLVDRYRARVGTRTYVSEMPLFTSIIREEYAEEFIEVRGFWLPAHLRSVTTSFLLGPTELNIVFSNYQLDQDPPPVQ